MLITWQPGQSIVNDRFTIEEVLGVGGFGITYKAKDSKGEIYAIKTLNPTIQNRVDFKEQQVKFINEALTVKGFRHPHIVKVYEVIQEGELFAVLMEYIKGIPLSKYIEENGQLTEVLALKYIDQISQALECVHKDNYLHRDIKPDNILLRNNYKDAVLMDFGLARIMSTQSMTNSLTHGFAPIEQYQRKANFGPHTDVYALGATLYYVLTANGLRLKGESSPVPAVNRKYDEEELPEPKSYNPSISKKVNDVIMAAMAINPEQRTKNIEEFRKDLGLIESKSLPKEEVLTVKQPEPLNEVALRQGQQETTALGTELSKLDTLVQNTVEVVSEKLTELKEFENLKLSMQGLETQTRAFEIQTVSANKSLDRLNRDAKDININKVKSTAKSLVSTVNTLVDIANKLNKTNDNFAAQFKLLNTSIGVRYILQFKEKADALATVATSLKDNLNQITEDLLSGKDVRQSLAAFNTELKAAQQQYRELGSLQDAIN
ncbi:serine/threonine-protein kinase, partial [Cylindrospermopsis raciborskii]|uniref:serine/threonine-protein kinase n=1 Tax=Cylindrospermopsis raciborskii TaxID=77022 RepID=UPI0038CFBE83